MHSPSPQGAKDQQKLETKRLDNQKQMKVFQASQAEILKETEEVPHPPFLLPCCRD